MDNSSSQEQHENDVHSLLQSKTAELFNLCDIEQKGFINKKDIQRMKEPLGVTPELLEEVFDSLDIDKNGYLTLEEFTTGFSSYLGIGDENENTPQTEIDQKSQNYQEQRNEDEDIFYETMDALGASHLIQK
jgi:Ca2+-binding EF-hand superfamily protein